MSWLIVFMSFLSPVLLLAILLSMNRLNEHIRIPASVGDRRHGQRAR
jgi:hypothetical protein